MKQIAFLSACLLALFSLSFCNAPPSLPLGESGDGGEFAQGERGLSRETQGGEGVTGEMNNNEKPPVHKPPAPSRGALHKCNCIPMKSGKVCKGQTVKGKGKIEHLYLNTGPHSCTIYVYYSSTKREEERRGKCKKKDFCLAR